MLNYFFLIYKFIIIGLPVRKNFLGGLSDEIQGALLMLSQIITIYSLAKPKETKSLPAKQKPQSKKKKTKTKTQVAQGLNWLPSPPKPVALVQVAPYNRMKKILQREHKVRQTDKVKWPQSVCRRTYQSAARGVMTSKRLLFSFLRIFSQQEVRTVVGRRGGCPQGKGSVGSC